MFTLNNFEDAQAPAKWFDSGNFRYIVWQHERGENGVDHLQGYAYLKKQSRITEMKKIDGRAHWHEQKYGSQEACIEYCQKEETRIAGPWKCGDVTISKRGKRNDILALRDAVRDGSSDLSLVLDDKVAPSFAKYPKFVETARRLFNQNDRKTLTNGIVLWGPPCTGKTTMAHEIAKKLHPLETPFPLPTRQNDRTGHWWDGYDGHKVVIIDEVDGGTFTGRDLCNLFDDKPLILPKKNGHVSFTAELIIMTSNKNPGKWAPLTI